MFDLPVMKRERHLKHLKFIHALLGLLGLVALLVDGRTVSALISKTLPASMSVFLLLVITLINLALGSYLSTCRCKKRFLQLLATLAMVTATTLIIASVFGYTYAPVYIIMELVCISVLLHALINMQSLNPSAPAFYDDSEREMGTVKWFNVTKGFGFITRDSGDDVFVHYRAIRGEGHRTLSEGQRVEFIVVNKDKGLQAEDVIAARKGR